MRPNRRRERNGYGHSTVRVGQGRRPGGVVLGHPRDNEGYRRAHRRRLRPHRQPDAGRVRLALPHAPQRGRVLLRRGGRDDLLRRRAEGESGGWGVRLRATRGPPRLRGKRNGAGQDTPAKLPGRLREVPRGSGRTGQGAEHTASGATRHGETDGDRRQVRNRFPGTASRPLGVLGGGPGRAGLLSCPYSPECVEGEFPELRHNGVLRSSCASLVLWSTYIPLRHEYAALVT